MNYSSFSSQELLQECVTRADAEAWEEFVRRFQPLIAGVVARTAMRWAEVSPGLVDDLVQETYLKICTDHFRRLREFENRFEDAIYGFLKAIAYNVTMDYFKVRHATKRGSQLLSKAEFDTALQTVAQEDSMEDQILLREIEDLVERITETDRDKLVFLLYYRQGFTAKAISELPGIELSEKGVESCLLRLTRQLRQHIVGSAKE
jgi:RNA polymerase sigma-70 factor (ECF subfamily)